MVDVLDLSARIIDSGLDFDPVSRMTQEVSEVADRVALAESFSHSVALRTGATTHSPDQPRPRQPNPDLRRLTAQANLRASRRGQPDVLNRSNAQPSMRIVARWTLRL